MNEQKDVIEEEKKIGKKKWIKIESPTKETRKKERAKLGHKTQKAKEPKKLKVVLHVDQAVIAIVILGKNSLLNKSSL